MTDHLCTSGSECSIYLADLADAKLSAADYAMKVRKLYDVLVEEAGDAEAPARLSDVPRVYAAWPRTNF